VLCHPWFHGSFALQPASLAHQTNVDGAPASSSMYTGDVRESVIITALTVLMSANPRACLQGDWLSLRPGDLPRPGPRRRGLQGGTSESAHSNPLLTEPSQHESHEIDKQHSWDSSIRAIRDRRRVSLTRSLPYPSGGGQETLPNKRSGDLAERTSLLGKRHPTEPSQPGRRRSGDLAEREVRRLCRTRGQETLPNDETRSRPSPRSQRPLR